MTSDRSDAEREELVGQLAMLASLVLDVDVERLLEARRAGERDEAVYVLALGASRFRQAAVEYRNRTARIEAAERAARRTG